MEKITFTRIAADTFRAVYRGWSVDIVIPDVLTLKEERNAYAHYKAAEYFYSQYEEQLKDIVKEIKDVKEHIKTLRDYKKELPNKLKYKIYG